MKLNLKIAVFEPLPYMELPQVKKKLKKKKFNNIFITATQMLELLNDSDSDFYGGVILYHKRILTTQIEDNMINNLLIFRLNLISDLKNEKKIDRKSINSLGDDKSIDTTREEVMDDKNSVDLEFEMIIEKDEKESIVPKELKFNSAKERSKSNLSFDFFPIFLTNDQLIVLKKNKNLNKNQNDKENEEKNEKMNDKEDEIIIDNEEINIEENIEKNKENEEKDKEINKKEENKVENKEVEKEEKNKGEKKEEEINEMIKNIKEMKIEEKIKIDGKTIPKTKEGEYMGVFIFNIKHISFCCIISLSKLTNEKYILSLKDIIHSRLVQIETQILNANENYIRSNYYVSEKIKMANIRDPNGVSLLSIDHINESAIGNFNKKSSFIIHSSFCHEHFKRDKKLKKIILRNNNGYLFSKKQFLNEFYVSLPFVNLKTKQVDFIKLENLENIIHENIKKEFKVNLL
jgi:hypothetical protein